MFKVRRKNGDVTTVYNAIQKTNKIYFLIFNFDTGKFIYEDADEFEAILS